MPPTFVRLAGHPVRWRLLSELARSDRQVRELCAAGRRAAEPGLLPPGPAAGRAAGVARGAARPTAATPTTVLDLARCGELLAAAGAALHPGCGSRRRPGGRAARAGVHARVLFLCTGNSAPLADGRGAGGAAVPAARCRRVSAGSHPSRCIPNAVRVMRERGIDISRPAVQAPERVRRASGSTA